MRFMRKGREPVFVSITKSPVSDIVPVLVIAPAKVASPDVSRVRAKLLFENNFRG